MTGVDSPTPGAAPTRAQGAAIDPRHFRDVLGRYASGLTIIGGCVDNALVGFTCQSFYSASIDPPLISFCVMNTSTSWPKIRPTGSFSVSVLSSDQQYISGQFSRSGIDRWAGVDRHLTSWGNPLVSGAMVWLDCALHREYEAGDHYIVLGEVREMNLGGGGEGLPLLYFKGHYLTVDH